MPRLKKSAIIDALQATNGRVYEAAGRLGCSNQALYKRLLADPELEQVRQEARAQIVDLAESQLLKKVKMGNLTAIIFVLKTLGQSRGYTERIEVEHGGAIEFRIGGIKPEQLAGRLHRWMEMHCKRSSTGSDRKRPSC